MTQATNGPIQSDVLEETLRLLGAAERRSLPIRVLGGMAIVLHAGERLHPSLRREIRDIDLATTQRSGRNVAQFLTEQGYEPNRTFNAMHGAKRLLFYDNPNGRQVDVFVGTFEMCHTLPLGERLLLEPVTVPLAELVLTKIQIVKLNEKDFGDLYALLLTHDVADHDDETINAARIAELSAKDWGLYRTLQLNLERLHERLPDVDLSADERNLVAERLSRVQDAIEHAPKSAKWKLRARVGDRVRWYEDPDEVAKGAY